MRGVKKQLVLAIGALAIVIGLMLFSSPRSGGPGFALAVETPISITAANVLAGAGATVVDNLPAGATITQGQLVYLDQGSQTYKLAAASTAATAVLAGIAATSAVSGQPIAVVTSGPAVTPGGTLTTGKPYCLGLTAGALILCSDEVASNYITFVGIATSTTKMVMKPVVSGAQQ